MIITWLGTALLGPGQVATTFAEVDIVTASTVGFTLTVDEPAIALSFTWDGQHFSHENEPNDLVVGIELVNMTVPGYDRCLARVKYVSETLVNSSAHWEVAFGDGDLLQAALTVE